MRRYSFRKSVSMREEERRGRKSAREREREKAGRGSEMGVSKAKARKIEYKKKEEN